MSKIKVGDTFQSTSCNTFTVIEVKNQENITIKFNDVQGYQVVTSSQTIRNGRVKNPYFPRLFNKGYFGVGLYKARIGSSSVNSKSTDEYRAWINMLSRCYDPNYIGTKAGRVCYSGVQVTDTWLNFQVFAEWYCKELKSPEIKFVLDKDLLSPDVKIYSPETCCLIPEQLNIALIDRLSLNKTRKLSTIRKCKNGTYSVGVSLNKKFTTFSGYKTEKECFDLYLSNKEKELNNSIEKYKSSLDEKGYLALIEYSSKNSIRISAYYDY